MCFCMIMLEKGLNLLEFVFAALVSLMLNKNTLCIKNMRGQSEAALQTGAIKNFDIS